MHATHIVGRAVAVLIVSTVVTVIVSVTLNDIDAVILLAIIMFTISTDVVLLKVRWLRDHEVSDTLLKELMEESTQVWAFIMEREIESPERFQAIQSYRAAMAVLRQQVHYIEQLRDSGMIDEAEEGMLLR